MIQIKYFSNLWGEIEDNMNAYIQLNKHIITVQKMHINQEVMLEGEICVNGYIIYDILQENLGLEEEVGDD